MAKRRRLDAPDPLDLEALEVGFAAKPAMGAAFAAPIAQIAAETAQARDPLPVAQRTEVARDFTAAEAYRCAQEEGRLILDLPLERIQTDHITRDRMIVSADDMDELKSSLRMSGQRLPIEVVALPDGKYGLISGWRRVTALQALQHENPARFSHVRALVRVDALPGGAYAAMVEENEIREQLTPYERGRIAVVAAERGAFASADQAVDVIFATASKAKRSKIRSFAVVHEELGGTLNFPTDLSERNGLRLAAALRLGFGAKLRAALNEGQGVDALTEMLVMEPVLSEAEAVTREPARGGRPKAKAKEAPAYDRVDLANGITMERVAHEDGYSIRLRGKVVDAGLLEVVMAEITRLLEPI
jgi:ParB family transcriptional regulator, chromosome partitioning protein